MICWLNNKKGQVDEKESMHKLALALSVNIFNFIHRTTGFT